MGGSHTTRRINIGLPKLYLDKLERYAKVTGQATASAAGYLIQTKLDEIELKQLSEQRLLVQKLINVLIGLESKESIDVVALAEVLEREPEEIEKLINTKEKEG